MNLSEIKQKIGIALWCLKSNDSELLDYGKKRLPERAITYKLASYLQILFNELTVDCEYNRHLYDTKMDEKKTPVTPDILIHKRKTDDNNLRKC